MQQAQQSMMSCQGGSQQVANTPNQQTNHQVPHQEVEKCVREGCNKPAVASEEWQQEYCSQECVVRHCNDIFSAWVASNLQQNTGEVFKV